jgi:hypothetical protein
MGYAQRAARAWAGLATAVAGLSAVAVFGFSAPAAADVSFDTEQAQRTGGARVAFKLTNDSPTATVTKFEVRFPGEYNIAEIYPIAVGEWAPMITMKPVDDKPENDVPVAVVWTAMPGKEIKPGATSLLPLAMGPMPDAEFLYLDVVVTRSDGSTETWAGVDTPAAGAQHPAFAVKLVPLKPGEVPEVGHGGAADTGAADTGVAQTEAADPAAADPSSTESSGPVGLAVVLLIIAALTGFALYWQRRRSATSTGNDRPNRNGAGKKGKGRAEAADDEAPAARIPAQRKKGAPPKKVAAAKKAPAKAAAAPVKAAVAEAAPDEAVPASPAGKPAAVQRRSVVRATAAKKAAGRRTVVRKSTGGAATVTLARRNGSASSRPGDAGGDNA